jgi:hypothetical protein
MNEIDTLLDLIRSRNTSDDVLCETARALLIMGDEKAVEPILERLKEEIDPPWVRKHLFTALAGSSRSSK